MKYLLDTNTCINYLNGTSEKVKEKFLEYTISELCLCSIVKAELFFGVFNSNNPTENLAKINYFFEPFVSLPFDDRAAKIYGNIKTSLNKKGTPIGPNDLLIASIALSNNLTLVTHNTKEFKRIKDLIFIDWE